MALTLSGLAKLRDAAVVLRETKGFAYLPIMVPHEVAGRDAIDELRSASAIDDALWHQVSWPQLDANEVSSSSPPSQRTLKEQRVELLQTFDSIVTSGTGLEHTIVLDASLSTRHTLALEVVTYLNQRREPLRAHRHRFILVWPAALSEALRGTAADLWSQRTLSVVLMAGDVVLPRNENFSGFLNTIPPAAENSNPVVAAQLTRWFATHDLHTANLSGADALSVFDALFERQDFVESQLIAQAIESSFPDDLELIARANTKLSVSLSHQGLREAALKAADNAVIIFRGLSQTNQAPYAADLAGTLNDLAARQSDVGDFKLACTTSREAVEIYRRLAKINPSAYIPHLAANLDNLRGFQRDAGSLQDALDTSEELLKFQRRLKAPGPETRAKYLVNSAIALVDTGDLAGALAIFGDAVETFRQLAKNNPASHEPNLATGLNNFANIKLSLGNYDDAISIAREAVGILRRLSEISPSVYEPKLVRSLCLLATALAEHGNVSAARKTASEAVSLIEPWAEKFPGAFASLREVARKQLADISKTF